MRKILLIVVLVLLGASMRAQVSNPGVKYVAVAPSGSCPAHALPVQVSYSNEICTCGAGTWSCNSGGGTGGPFLPLTGGALTGPLYFGMNSGKITNALTDTNGVFWQQTTNQGSSLGIFDASLGEYTHSGHLPNEVMGIGWNVSAGGNPLNPAFPMTRFVEEDNYCPSSYCQTEMHIEQTPPNTASRTTIVRTFSSAMRNDSGQVITSITGDQINFDDPADLTGNTSWELIGGQFYLNNLADNTITPIFNLNRNASFASNTSFSFDKSQDMWVIGGPTNPATGESGTLNVSASGNDGIGINAAPQLGTTLWVNNADHSKTDVFVLASNTLSNGSSSYFSVRRNGIPFFLVQELYTSVPAIVVNDGAAIIGFSGNYSTQTYSINSSTGAASFASATLTALTGTKLPLCETSGVITAGTNTAGALACP